MAHNTLFPLSEKSAQCLEERYLELAIQLTITIGRRIVPGSRSTRKLLTRLHHPLAVEVDRFTMANKRSLRNG